MALITNTITRYDYTKSVREDLSDLIYNISPVDVPFQSNIGRDKASQTFTEWQTDTLAAATTTNAQLEGDDIVTTVDARAATNRVGNYTQISRKIVSVTGTLEASNKAGMRSARAYNLAKAANELKRDIEATLTSLQVAVVGNNTVARKTAGLGGWIITNYTPGTGTVAAAPVMSSGSDGYPATAAVAGTATVMTETRLKTAIQNVWTQGGSPDFVMCGPFNKTVISGFAGIATRFRDVPAGRQAQIIGAADAYVSDFGTVNIVPNRFQPENSVYLVDKSMAAVSYLRPYQSIPMAKTGDADKTLLIVEYALKVRNERAFARIADCTTA
jgi:Family of unknown function (DUF5309)